MRRAILVVSFAGLACMFSSKEAIARAEYLKGFKTKYGDNGGAYDTLIDGTKCYICHVGTKKPNRNEYGIALSKMIAKKEKVPANIDAALGKVEDKKSKDGQTFGELIKDHKLPTEPIKEDP